MIFVKEKDGKVTLTYNYYIEARVGCQPEFIDIQREVIDVR